MLHALLFLMPITPGVLSVALPLIRIGQSFLPRCPEYAGRISHVGI
jgi:hypothetical protein